MSNTQYPPLKVGGFIFITMRLLDSIKSLVCEAIEWNDGDYDYQYGYCHYFAYDIIGKLKELYPEKDIRYLLLLISNLWEKFVWDTPRYMRQGGG